MDKLLTKDDIAEALQVTTRTVHAMIKDGRLPPPIKFGRAVRWLPADILKALEAMRVEA